jgi:hypothetical protein
MDQHVDKQTLEKIIDFGKDTLVIRTKTFCAEMTKIIEKESEQLLDFMGCKEMHQQKLEKWKKRSDPLHLLRLDFEVDLLRIAYLKMIDVDPESTEETLSRDPGIYFAPDEIITAWNQYELCKCEYQKTMKNSRIDNYKEKINEKLRHHESMFQEMTKKAEECRKRINSLEDFNRNLQLPAFCFASLA